MLAVPVTGLAVIGHGGGNILSQGRFYACRARNRVGSDWARRGKYFVPGKVLCLPCRETGWAAIGHGGGNVLSQRRFYACRAEKPGGQGLGTAGEIFFPWEGFMLAVPVTGLAVIGHGGGNVLSLGRFYACRAEKPGGQGLGTAGEIFCPWEHFMLAVPRNRVGRDWARRGKYFVPGKVLCLPCRETVYLRLGTAGEIFCPSEGFMLAVPLLVGVFLLMLPCP
ncbi:hypothetical protein [Microseira wollei]|uniref:Uncharacterized protein n=1 Tax=Microseira wollei NIES-4236 TaxID=2530354 RepID=A0AAV3XPU7_9CYAN|nr:hypothetical protein [Microseira wollei]GET43678.1 hypothetical protein MiSe_85030 [Microseira wollei NIES-4236]